ncbi:MAG: LysE family transporter, partial [Atribacterota bacterium]|nr:LysE family transporter [Atribacterota bacterium]
MFLSFLFKTVIISLSGVMAPGPITAMTVSKGTQNPHSGPMIAIGHGIVELPLILIIFFGFGNFLEITWVKVA